MNVVIGEHIVHSQLGKHVDLVISLNVAPNNCIYYFRETRRYQN
jgi:hypothetical protein